MKFENYVSYSTLELDMSLLLKFIGVDEGTGHFKPLEKKFVWISSEKQLLDM